MDAKPTKNSSKPFKLITFTLALLLAGVLTLGLMHVSEEPVVLGRYSLGYASMLLAISVALAALLTVLLYPHAGLHKFLSNTYLLIGTTVVTLIAVEIGLRILNPWGIEFFHTLPYHMQGMLDHPVLGYVHPRSTEYSLGKNWVSLNSHGLRDEEFQLAKPPDEKRVLVLGDSVAFGWGVSQGETFSDRMEELLQLKTSQKWQVINAGVNGYNSEQEANWFRNYGLLFKPDLVILVYVNNDVEPILDPNVTTWRRYPSSPASLPEALERVRSLSYLFQMSKLMQRTREMEQTAHQGVASVTRHPRWPISRVSLVDIAVTCRESGIPFLVAVNSGRDPAFVGELEILGISTVQLETAWEKVPMRSRHVSRVDPHPSAAVHKEIAVLLVDEFERRHWLRR